MATPAGGEVADEGRVAHAPVDQADLVAAVDDADQHAQAHDDEAQHGDDLDQREPVFGFAEAARREAFRPKVSARKATLQIHPGESGNQ